MLRTLFISSTVLFCSPAFAITGDAPPADAWAARPIVMVVDRKATCHRHRARARPGAHRGALRGAAAAPMRSRRSRPARPIGVRRSRGIPRFNLANYAASRATADVALVKLDAPLPDIVVPASLAAARRVAPGETLAIAGFGVTAAGTARGLGVPRSAKLTVTGKPGASADPPL